MRSLMLLALIASLAGCVSPKAPKFEPEKTAEPTAAPVETAVPAVPTEPAVAGATKPAVEADRPRNAGSVREYVNSFRSIDDK